MSMRDPLNHLGSIWYQSEPLETPISQTKSFLVGTFFCHSLQQTGSTTLSPRKFEEKWLENTVSVLEK